MKASPNISTKALFKTTVEGDGAEVWVKPQKDVIKITVDAATFEEFSAFGVGMLARDHTREVVLGKSVVCSRKVSPDYAEAMAIEEALSWVKGERWKEVIIESDCLVAIQAIRSKMIMISPYGQVINECMRLSLDLNIKMFLLNGLLIWLPMS